MNTGISNWSKGIGAAGLLVAALLAGCGSSGDADPAGVFEDSITISDLTGTDTGTVGQTYTMEVKVVVTGGVPADQITYTWEQTQGTAVIDKQQVNGEYKSNLSFKPVAAGDVTFKVTTTTASGRTSSQAKTMTVNAL